MLKSPLIMAGYSNDPFGERIVNQLGSITDNPADLLSQSSTTSLGLINRHDTTLDILSASEYPHALMQPYSLESASTRFSRQDRVAKKRKSDPNNDQLYGGIVVAPKDSKTTESSVVMTEPTPARKKSKRSSSNDDEDVVEARKQRGRPRLHTQDETAADRRRTQIRLAQRAYRHRKETTISALKKQVDSLQSAIEQMNTTFTQLYDNLITTGVTSTHQSLSSQLLAASETFSALTKSSAVDSDPEEDIDRIGEIAQSTPPTNRQRSTRSNHNTSQADSANEEDIEVLPLFDNSLQPWIGSQDFTQFNVQIPDFSFQGLDNMSTPSIGSPKFQWNTSIDRPLRSPVPRGTYTYSFQETTFARRLHRMCLERAYRNLMNPDIDPDYTKRTFRFTFCISTRERALRRFQEFLTRKAGESLENWGSPYFNIGGAGTHFPRKDKNGNPVYPPNLQSPARFMAPLNPFIRPETPRSEKTLAEMLEAIGFGGEWFDSHDVEEYLKTKGIYLDGTSSFVEVNPTLAFSENQSTSPMTTISGPSPVDTPPSLGNENPDPIIINNLMSDNFNLMDWAITHSHASPNSDNALALLSDKQPALSRIANLDPITWLRQPHNTFSAFEAIENLDENPSPDTSSHASKPIGPKTVTIDVEQFLERLVEGGVCLGRAPGFRKNEIDRALALSLQEAF